MKIKTLPQLSVFSLLLFLPLFATNSFATPANDDTLLEITDRNNQISLGISNNSITVTITEELRVMYNNEIRLFERKEWHTFSDSGGNYIPSTHSYLDSDIIEIPLSDIKSIHLMNDGLDFTFDTYSKSEFKNVLSDLGSDFFKNFSSEDLASFHQVYLSVQ